MKAINIEDKVKITSQRQIWISKSAVGEVIDIQEDGEFFTLEFSIKGMQKHPVIVQIVIHKSQIKNL